MIDFVGAALAILKAVKGRDLEVDPKLIVIKPRILSDENILRGVSAIKAALSFYPPAAVASPALGLGMVGFKIWKRISLSRDYDELLFPPVDPNMLRLSIATDPELNKHYGHLVEVLNPDEDTLSELEAVYNDFQFITTPEFLIAKYPNIDMAYIKERAAHNYRILGEKLDKIEQSIVSHSLSPEIEHNVRDAFNYVRSIFPAMNDWALFNSESFNELIETIDTIV